jgi:hypothetical protein
MFKKSIETEYGDSAEFWKVISINLRPPTKKCEVRMSVWKNKNAYQAGKSASIVLNIDLDKTDFPFSNGELKDILESVKLKIKATQALFSDAGFEE